MSRTNYVTKVCGSNYYTLMKWIEGMSSTLAPRNCVCWTLDPISAVRDCVPEGPEGGREEESG